MNNKQQAIALIGMTTALVAYGWIFNLSVVWGIFPFLVGAGIFSLSRIPFFFKIWLDALHKVFRIKITLYKKRYYLYNFAVFLILLTLAEVIISHNTEILEDPVTYVIQVFSKNTIFMIIGFISNFMTQEVIKKLKPRGSRRSYGFTMIVIAVLTLVVVHSVILIVEKLGLMGTL